MNPTPPPHSQFTSSPTRNLALLTVMLGSLSWLSAAAPAGENLALGKPVQFATPPNYSLCTDADDARQLTDGKYTSGYFWTQKSTVGWQNASPVVLTLDFGKAQPISGLSYSTAAGVAGVGWPASIYIAVSDEGRTWRYAGDLLLLSAKQGLPPTGKYGTHRFITGDLQTRGRFVRLAVVPQGNYTFCDEIEVHRGPESLLARAPAGEAVTDIRAFVRRGTTRSGMTLRLTSDLAAARETLASAKLPESRKQALRARLDEAEREIARLPDPNPDSFKAVLPLNDLHARICSVFGPVLQSSGLPAFFVWKQHRYDYLTPQEMPVTAPPTPALDVTMMQNEFRADAFLVSNLSEQPLTATLRVQGLPGAPAPSWLRVAAVPWTDTSHRQPVAAALPDAECVAGEYRVPVSAGFTCKVWLTVNSTGLKPGTYRGTLVVAGAGKLVSVPFNIRVAPVKMNRPRLSLGMWDYCDGRGNYGINPTNRAAAIELMRSHFVDTAWGQGGVLPWPPVSAFDQNHRLKAPLSFAAFDAWLQLWPGARNYFVFPSVGATFAGAKMGTAEFNARVGTWAKALSAHMVSLGLKPQQLGLLLVDEPHSDEQDERIAAWGRAINAAAPELTLFQDPTWDRPDRTKVQEAITLADIVCPNIPIFYRGGKDVARYFAGRRAAGQTMWFYQCSGPAKLYDPYRYHRLQAWHAFQHGAVGMGFWAFGDTGGAQSSWNEYAAAHTPFTPAFLSPDGAVDGVHWQAVREGIEDYEYLAMLRDAAQRSKDSGWKAKAEALLNEAPQAVLAGYSPVYDWKNAADRTLADQYRLRVLALLEASR